MYKPRFWQKGGVYDKTQDRDVFSIKEKRDVDLREVDQEGSRRLLYSCKEADVSSKKQK